MDTSDHTIRLHILKHDTCAELYTLTDLGTCELATDGTILGWVPKEK